MSGLKKTFMVEGLNRNLLLKRLHKAKIAVLDLVILDEKHAKITIDSKDCDKYFAICRKTWYNKLIKTSGIFAPIYKTIKKPFAAIGVIIFFVTVFFADNIYLGTEYFGDAKLYAVQTEKYLSAQGVRIFYPFNEAMLSVAEKNLEKDFRLKFLKIEKRGNKAVVYIKSNVDSIRPPQYSTTDICAPEDLVVLKMVVYSGTPLVNVGESVKKGEPLIGAYNIVNEQRVACKIVGSISAKCAFYYEYECKYDVKSQTDNAVAAAKVMLGDYEVKDINVKIVQNKIQVILYYEKIIFGG